MAKEDDARQKAIDGLLREMSRGKRGVDEDFVARVMADVEEESRDWRWKELLGVCAAVILTICLFVISENDTSNGAGQRVAIASLRDSRGEVELTRAGEIIRLVPGELIYAGDRLSCAGVAVVDYKDQSMIELKEGTCVFSQSEQDGKNLKLIKGAVMCSVVEQDASSPMTFSTPHGQGEVVGTMFEMRVSDDETKVKTLRGSVKLWETGLYSKAIDLGRDTIATVTQTDIQVTEVNPQSLLPGGVLWAQEFGSEYGPEADIEGEVSELQEGQRRISALVSEDVHPNEEDYEWYPEEWASIELKSRDAIFELPPDWEIVLRVKSESAGRMKVAMTPENPDFKAENVVSEYVEVGPEWIDVVLDESHFTPHRSSRTFDPGTRVRSVTVWSFDGAGKLFLDRVQVRRKGNILW